MPYRSLSGIAVLFLLVIFVAAFLGLLPQQSRAAVNTACADAYALWAHREQGNKVLDWDGSSNVAQGKVHSNGDVELKGSNNTILSGIEYVSSFSDEGENNVYAGPYQVAPGSMPASYNIEHYRPGGIIATLALAEGRYTIAVGDLVIDQDGTQLDGLYYVIGKAVISASNVGGQFTIVAEESVEVSGSNQNFSPYADGLLFFGNKSGGHAVKLPGSNSVFHGVIYAPRGDLELSGSTNTFNGTLLAHKVKLQGSLLNLNFDSNYCPTATYPTATPLPLPSATPTLPVSPTPTATPLSGPFFMEVALPIAVKDVIVAGPGEPNNICQEAYGLEPEITYQMRAEDQHDWYHFTLATASDVTVRLTNFVPEVGQVAVYRGATCGNAVFLQNNGDTGREKTVALGQQPAGHYFVYVSNDGEFNNHDYYGLLIELSP